MKSVTTISLDSAAFEAFKAKSGIGLSAFCNAAIIAFNKKEPLDLPQKDLLFTCAQCKATFFFPALKEGKCLSCGSKIFCLGE